MSKTSAALNYLRHELPRKIRDTPDNLRLATIGAWRGRERGMAVFAGVFLASLVITTVLSYGVGLSQVFFEESLENNIFDAKVEFKNPPADGTEGWTNNTATLIEVCDEFTAMEEFSDCTVVYGKKGIHGQFTFGNEDVWMALPLGMKDINSSDQLRNWESQDIWDYEYNNGPPISDERAITFLGPGAFDGVLADRLSENIIYERGSWATLEDVEESRGVYIPSDVASKAGAEAGDFLERLEFAYTVESALDIEAEDCEGEIYNSREVEHCQVLMVVENLTILGIYDPWPQGNPTLAANPIYATWSVLNESQRITLVDYDHFYFGLTLERSLLPTTSTADASDWLDDLSMEVQEKEFAGGEVEIYYVDIVGGTIDFLEIFLGLIQAFDYVIMVPIVVLSLSVLIYGLILSLEQRRREISIHRVIGATAKDLRGMVLLELAVVSFVAWLAGYLLAMAAVPVVLASVGFMKFEALGFNVDPSLSFTATLFTAITTLGLALLFGRSRTRDFMELEIDEGVSRVQKVAKPKVWLHWTLFLVGSLGAIDTYLEMNGSEDGILTNWFVEGLINVFGPFMLWIGGALLLGKIGAAGPRIMQFFFSRTPLLSDVKRGLKGSGSTESVNRLAVIMLLTLSIVTLAAVQGYTGTQVDEITADLQVGSDLQVVTNENYSATEIESMIQEISDNEVTALAVTVPTIALIPDGGEELTAYVLLDEGEDILRWFPQAIPGDDTSDALDAYREGGFSAGEDAAYAMDLWGSGRKGGDDYGDILLSESSSNTEDVEFIWEDKSYNWTTQSVDVEEYNTTLRYIGVHEFIPGVPDDLMSTSVVIGESGYRELVGDNRVDNLFSNNWIVKVDGVEGEDLTALKNNIEADERFNSTIDWETAHDAVERNGGLIFGTPGLLSLQFIVASVAAVASAFVFLSLVLNQRQKELAVLQAIGASPNQIIRLVLFEILSIVIVSMALGILLGMGLALSFNGLFNVFGFIFQILGSDTTSAIDRQLVWPWFELAVVSLAVFAAVVIALLVTTRKALKSDLASVLKGE